MYNASAYIARCLDSILCQKISIDDYEIIIINDGSTDNSVNIVEKYQNKYPHIKLFNQDNQGQSVARNRGIKEATGKYLWFIDADDFLIPNTLHEIFYKVFYTTDFTHLKEWRGYSECDLITFDVLRGPDKDYNESSSSNPITKIDPILTGCDFISKFPNRFPNGPWWYFIRKEFIENNSLYFQDGKLLEDGLFIITALLKASKVGHISQTLYYYAIRQGSTMYTYTPEQLEKINDGFRNAISYLTELLEENKTKMEATCYDRLIARRNGYVVFLLIRLLKYGTPRYAKRTLKQLKKQNLYPINNLIGKDYKSLRMRSLSLIINKDYIYLLGCHIYNTFKSFRK